VTRGRWTVGALLAVISALIALALVAWFAPGGPAVSLAYGAGFDAGYVGNHYGFFQAVAVHHSFAPTSARVAVNGRGCQGEVRLLTRVPTTSLSGVSAGPMPGQPVVGRKVTKANNRLLTVVLTPVSRGRCTATSLTVTAHSWGRQRSTTVPLDFYVDATHASGTDSRAQDFPIGK